MTACYGMALSLNGEIRGFVHEIRYRDHLVLSRETNTLRHAIDFKVEPHPHRLNTPREPRFSGTGRQ